MQLWINCIQIGAVCVCLSSVSSHTGISTVYPFQILLPLSYKVSLYNNWSFSFLFVFVLSEKCWALLFWCLLISFFPKQIPRWFGFITFYVPPCHLFSPRTASSSAPSSLVACSESHGNYLNFKQSASLEYLLVFVNNLPAFVWALCLIAP